MLQTLLKLGLNSSHLLLFSGMELATFATSRNNEDLLELDLGAWLEFLLLPALLVQ